MKFDILFGGVSFEHEISIVSAIALKKVLGNKIGNFIFLDASHRFYLIPADKLKSKLFSSNEYKKEIEIFLQRGAFVKKNIFGFKQIVPNVIINLIHGADGEDGKICSLLEFYALNFIGPRLEGSVLSFNKVLTKLFANDREVRTLPFEVLKKGESKNIKMPLPVILKPATLGSSIGVSVVKEQNELDYAMDVAYEFDDVILVEPFKNAIKEYNLAGCKIGDEFIFSMIEEPKKNELLDFNDKYLDFSRTERATQADIKSSLESKLKENFKKLYSNAFEGAIIRCDFFVIKDEVYLNEINPIPGSMANYLFSDFIGILDSLALNLPKAKNIKVSYKYIEKIHHAKGKC